MRRDGEDPIVPIRTRGPLRQRQAADAAVRAVQPIRLRGAIPTRGAVPSRPGTPRAVPLAQLVAELREEVADAPITVLLHGWTTRPARELLELLAPLLRRQDALWLVPPSGQPTREQPRPPAGAVVLHPAATATESWGTEARTYRNLVAEMVFLPAAERREVELVEGWRRRLRAMVVDHRGELAGALERRALAAGLFLYRWSGGELLERVEGDPETGK